MRFVHALDAIFELTAVVRKLLSHLIDAARHVATECGPDDDNLADFELVGAHWTFTAPLRGSEKSGRSVVQLKPVPLAQ